MNTEGGQQIEYTEKGGCILNREHLSKEQWFMWQFQYWEHFPQETARLKKLPIHSQSWFIPPTQIIWKQISDVVYQVFLIYVS
jgi:hypothetical protein